MNGKEYTFMYADKPVYFDPNQMLSDLIRIESGLVSRNLDISETFETLVSRFPAKADHVLPSVICEFKSGNTRYTVSRYTLNHENYPVSQYIFEEDQQLVGVFCRIYDYGSLIKKFITLFESDFVEKDETVNLWKWQNPNDSWFLVEKFGHTQLWCWKGELKKWK
jgi:hypothetical protein